MAATTTLFFAHISPHQHRLPVQNLSSIGSNKLWQPSSAAAQSATTLTKPSLLLRASSSSTVEKQDEEEEESSISTPSDGLTDQSEPIASIPLGGCKACGKAEIERGCNGEGRIQGGIATVPGFGWWPIKAYRPCPGFVATGGRYRRQGQSMDEVAGFGNVPRISSKTDAAATTTTAAGETQSSKKKGGPRKIKRER